MNLQEIKGIDGWENLIKHYPNWSGSLLEFMELKLISDKDKIWLFSYTKSVNDSIKREFAFICGEIAMQYTNKAEIHEFHILNLLDYNSNSFDSAAYHAAYSAAYSAAYHAADSTAYSAAYSAAYHAADSTAYSAAYSAAYHAADSTAYSAAYHAANSAANSAAHSTAYHAADSTAYSAARRNQVDIIKNLLEGVE